MSTVALTRKQTTNLVLSDPGTISAAALNQAKSEWADCKHAHGFNRVASAFGTSPTDNFKFAKSESLIYGLSLAQSRLSGINVCRWSTPVCVGCCVAGNGNGAYPSIVRARIAKTRFLFESPDSAAILLADFLDNAVKVGCRLERPVGARLNTFSDLDWQRMAGWIFNRYPTVNFFDYTKDWSRVSLFPNYSLTYSVSERTPLTHIQSALEQNQNVAVVFDTPRGKPLPSFFMGYEVFDGDLSDERWKDPKGVVVGLRAKGRMRTSGKGMVYAG